MMENGLSKTIKLYSVPFNLRGSTDLLLRYAVNHAEWPDYSNIIYVAPTPRKIREAQKKFHKLVKSPYIPPKFFTLKQLSKNLFDIKSNCKYFPDILVPLLISDISGHSIGYSSILSELLKELKQHHPSKAISLVRQELNEIFDKLGIPEDAFKKLNAALDIFEKYHNILSNLDYYDENDILNYGQSAAGCTLDKFSVLIADGFYDMTASEKNLLKELINKAEATLISYPAETNNSLNNTQYNNNILSFITDSYINYIKFNFNVTEEHLEQHFHPDFSYIKYNSIEDEIEGIARHIKSLFIIGRLRADNLIIVTFPRISDYIELTERIFRRYGLPYSVSLKKPPAYRGAVRDIFYLLESIIEDFPRLKFTSFLSSPYFKKLPELLRTHIPSLSRKSGIIKGREAWENLSKIIEDKSFAKSIKDDISHIFKILDRLIKNKDSAEIEVIHYEIENILSELGCETEQADIDMLNNSMDMIRVVFSELSREKTISLKRYVEFQRHILGSIEYQTEDYGIQLMDFLETRGLEPDYLYFCGLKDGDMPCRPPIDLILPDSVRTEYGLVNLKKYLSIQKLNFLRIIGATSKTHLSYPSIDGDKYFLPSTYLSWGKEITENVTGIFSPEELLARKGKHLLSDTINEVRLDRRTKDRLSRQRLSMPMRVTDIDYYRKCPRRFFIEKVLNLEAAEIAEYEVEAKLLGNIIHSIMEELIKETIEDSQTFKQKALSIINRTLQDYIIWDYWKNLIKEAFMEILPEIMDLESKFRKEGFTPYGFEMKLKEEVLPGTFLTGKIDRVDRRGESFRIIDYKTGTVNIGSDIIKKGKELQLPLYAAMLKSKGIDVEKAGIYSLKDIGIKWIPTKKDKYTFDEYIISTLKYLEETILQIRAGNFDALPLEEFYCTSCAEAPFCPYINSK